MCPSQVLLTNNFQSKKINLSNLAKNHKEYKENSNISGKEVLSFIVDDIKNIKVIPGGYHTFGNYDFNLNSPNPQDAINGSWGLYSTLNPWCSVGLPPLDWPGTRNQSIVINDGGTVGILYYFKQLTNEQQNQIKSTGIGECSFTIALPHEYLKREADYQFTEINERYPEELKKPENFANQQNFISFGAYDSTRPLLRFRFNLIWRVKYIPETDSYQVFSFKNTSEDLANGVMVPNWDGTTLKEFKCEYGPDIEGHITGKLYYFENGSWVLFRENITPSEDAATYLNAPEFGCYSTPAIALMAIKKFNFRGFIRTDYSYKMDGIIYENCAQFTDYLYEKYQYDIGGTGNISIDWFFDNKHNIVDLNTNKITFDKSWFTPDTYLQFLYFNKKQKKINVYADKGSITSFINPEKRIVNINVADLPNLTSINLAKNDLTSLDLSKNSKIGVIDVSDNVNLDTLILPFGNILSINYINIINTKITSLELIDTSSIPKEVLIKCDDILGFENLTLVGIKILEPELFVSKKYPNIKYVNISESNILTNKTNLETFLNNLPDRTGLDCGKIFMYGRKYIKNGKQGSAKDIAQVLDALKHKNWIFYL